MKKSIFVILVFMGLVPLFGQKFIELGASYEDDGILGNIAYTWLPVRNETRLSRVVLSGNIEQYEKGNEDVPVSRYTLAFEHYRSINKWFDRESSNTKLYLGGGLFGVLSQR